MTEPIDAARNAQSRQLLSALDEHCPGERLHAERVAVFAVAMGDHLGLPLEELVQLRWAAELHDIGKLDLDRQLLTLGVLEAEDFVRLREHPEHGRERLTGWPEAVRQGVAQHHERWDGRGYPRGLALEEICLFGRLIAVAEVFDVLTQPVAWREPMREPNALAEMLRCSGTQFDPAAVDALIAVQPLIQPLARGVGLLKR